jgi:cytochrome c oxidase assembly factor CtaG
VHAWVIRIIRSKPVTWITWPAVGIVAYAAVVVGTHLTNFMNLVIQYDAVHEAEHVLYLVVGYLYFLPLVGKEPIKWKMSYPLRLFLLFLAMPVDAFTGVVLGSYSTYPFRAMAPRNWGPTPINDLHQGGAVMWIGGAAIMFLVIMVTFFSWSREPRSSAAMGWFETARRATMADRMSEAAPNAPAARVAAGASGQGGRPADVDDDDDQLAAYNAYLNRINGPVSHNSKATE